MLAHKHVCHRLPISNEFTFVIVSLNIAKYNHNYTAHIRIVLI